MKNINKALLSTLVTATAIISIPTTAKAQYYNYSYPSGVVTTYPSQTSNSSYTDYYNRMRARDKRHQQQINLIRGN